MNCLYVRENLSALLDKELAPEVERTVKAHLGDCEPCRREFERLSLSWGLLDEWKEAGVPARISSAILNRLSHERKRRRVLGLLPAAAVLLIVIGVYLLYGDSGSKRTLPGPAATVTLSEDAPRQDDINEDDIISNLPMLKDKAFFDSLDTLKKMDYLPLVDEPGSSSPPAEEGNAAESVSA